MCRICWETILTLTSSRSIDGKGPPGGRTGKRRGTVCRLRRWAGCRRAPPAGRSGCVEGIWVGPFRRENAHAAERAEEQQLGRGKNADTVFCYQPGGGTGKQRLEKAAAAGGQNGGALPEAVQGAADGKQQAEKPAAQKRRHAIGRHAEPDDSNADAGGKRAGC